MAKKTKSRIRKSTSDGWDRLMDGEKPVLVDFFATWCPPCKALAPTLERLAEDYEGEVRFAKVDIDAEEELADDYEIDAIPTLVLFVDGEEIDRFEGTASKRELAAWLDELIED